MIDLICFFDSEVQFIQCFVRVEGLEIFASQLLRGTLTEKNKSKSQNHKSFVQVEFSIFQC